MTLIHGDCGNNVATEYNSHRSMMARCYNSNHMAFHNYGGRGIKVYKRWHSYPNFLKDMGRKPSKQHSLDRIDNDANYKPSNCRWATKTEQLNNTRFNSHVCLFGIKYTTSQAARKFDINYGTLKTRLRRGWEPHDAVLTL